MTIDFNVQYDIKKIILLTEIFNFFERNILFEKHIINFKLENVDDEFILILKEYNSKKSFYESYLTKEELTEEFIGKLFFEITECESCKHVFLCDEKMRKLSLNKCIYCCKKTLLFSDFEVQNNCSICQESLFSAGNIVKTRCNHNFHHGCLVKIKKTINDDGEFCCQCPMCRAKIDI